MIRGFKFWGVRHPHLLAQQLPGQGTGFRDLRCGGGGDPSQWRQPCHSIWSALRTRWDCTQPCKGLSGHEGSFGGASWQTPVNCCSNQLLPAGRELRFQGTPDCMPAHLVSQQGLLLGCPPQNVRKGTCVGWEWPIPGYGHDGQPPQAHTFVQTGFVPHRDPTQHHSRPPRTVRKATYWSDKDGNCQVQDVVVQGGQAWLSTSSLLCCPLLPSASRAQRWDRDALVDANWKRRDAVVDHGQAWQGAHQLRPCP